MVNAITNATTMVYCSDFAQAFIHSISKIMSGYKEGRVIFDRYIENSLKSQTRNKRSGWVEPIRFDINDSTNIKLIPLKTFLSHIDTKAKLTEHLGKALLAKFSDSEKNLVVVHGTSTYANYPGLFHPNIRNHQHEEADTLTPMHVLDTSKTDGDRHRCIFTRCRYICSLDRLGGKQQHWRESKFYNWKR